MSLALTGIGVSRGVAIGRAYLVQRGQPEIIEYAIPARYLDDEVARYREAVAAARRELKAVRGQIPEATRADIVHFFDAHLLMLKDPALVDAPIEIVRERQCNAEWALKGCIVIADDLTPADAVLMEQQGVAGFITEGGGPLSHTSIIARNLGIPAVVGVRHARRLLRDDEPLILDGLAGAVLADAGPAVVRRFRSARATERRYQAELAALSDLPALTLDRREVQLHANIEMPEDVIAARRVQAAGVGLYRTESLYMNRDEPPDEETQYLVYARVVHALKGAPLTIRTLDAGADKPIGYHDDGPPTANPALGLRAIRLCLKDPQLFLPQLRAILRASAHGPVRLMVPMLATLQELTQVQDLLDQARAELAAAGRAFDPRLPVGGMIEVPAAAVVAPLFARRLDFMSIGTNDLIQYTLAMDRAADDVNYLYDPLHPAVLTLITGVIEAGAHARIPVAMCGEMAGDPRYTRLLLGMGLTEFSMQPASLLEVKRMVRASDCRVLKRRVRRILESTEPDDIARQVEALNAL